MKNKNTVTVIIQPDWRKKNGIASTKTFRVPVRVIYYLAIGFAMLVGFGINGSKSISKNIILHITAAAHRQSLENLRSLEKKVERLSREQSIVRSFLGIEDRVTYDTDEKTGIGGSHPSVIKSSLPAPLQEDSGRTPAEPVPLHKRVHDLYESFHELTGILSKMSKRLNSTPTIMPVKDDDIWITSWFGWRRSPFTGLKEFHKGLDLSAKRGVPIMVTADGMVIDTGNDRFLGNFVVVRHDARYTTLYGHLLQIHVKKDQMVKRGQVIGTMGNTGISTGYHLHYEVMYNQKNIDPYNFILDRKEGLILADNS